MEDRTESPIAVKVEKHSQYVILTYFQGDISSMVDAHFTRALSKVYKANAPAAKAKKMRKAVKLEDATPCQSSAVDIYTDSQVRPPGRHLLSFGSADSGPASWQSHNPRVGEGPVLPSIHPYSLPPEGLGLTGQQCATSLLNLLHSDRGDMGPSMPSSSKPEMLPSWSMPQGFIEPTDSLNAVGFEHARRVDKKDLYWY